ncbi:MAG TPA: hypothetical protein EYP56_12525 [Planctomycetaceae bacterium]|nr:hypothetical protein [Planctomycetaceae bacterium]
MSDAAFTFKERGEEIDVYWRGRLLGTIVRMTEGSGRRCYRLGADTRKRPRTYRGRLRAAEVLRTIHSLKRQAEKSGWTLEELIVRAWDAKPSTAGYAARG